MININTKIHDQFSIEFKVGFAGIEQDKASDFAVNTWIFVPYSLDINSATFGKEQFYQNVKSNVRLITPTVSLEDLAAPKAKPLLQVEQACQRLHEHATAENQSECEFQIRLFAAIFKSALRDEAKVICACADASTLNSHGARLIQNIQDILRNYRAIHYGEQTFAFADEYISHLSDVHLTKVIRHLETLALPTLQATEQHLIEAVLAERNYKVAHGYSHIDEQGSENNQELVYRHGLLKKNIESALYLRVDTAPDSDAAQQISFGAAAGIAMILSTLVALPFQKYLGNYPTLIFIILVLAYIFKDRLKDYVRARFVHRLKAKYYDNKSIIRFKNSRIGWIKEGMDFINDDKAPLEVLKIRNRSDLESDNAKLGERIMLYRKQVHIENDQLRDHYQYDFSGINDILRLHIQRFTQKMDDPTLCMDTINKQGKLSTLEVPRLYFLNIVQQFTHGEQVDYKGFKLAVTRNGIVSIDNL